MTNKGKKSKRKKQGKAKNGFNVIRTRAAGIDLGSREHYVACPLKADGEAFCLLPQAGR